MVVSEFIGGQHTAKNVMISAIKRKKLPTESEVEGYRTRLDKLMGAYRITRQKLGELLGVIICENDENDIAGERGGDKRWVMPRRNLTPLP